MSKITDGQHNDLLHTSVQPFQQFSLEVPQDGLQGPRGTQTRTGTKNVMHAYLKTETHIAYVQSLESLRFAETGN